MNRVGLSAWTATPHAATEHPSHDMSSACAETIGLLHGATMHIMHIVNDGGSSA